MRQQTDSREHLRRGNAWVLKRLLKDRLRGARAAVARLARRRGAPPAPDE